MAKKYSSSFNFGLITILVFALFLRLFALRNNNFYFTMDQARDALAARQILKGNLTLKGPTTAIKDFYTGPLWYYLIVVGYFFSFGHPIGPIIILIFINLLTITLMMFFLKKYLNSTSSLVTGLGLAILQPFFQTSWYAFNPHLLPFICLTFILFLSLFNIKKQHFYLLAAISLGLSFHSEIAFCPPLILVFLIFGLYQLITKKLDLLIFSSGLAIVICFLLPHLFSELTNNFSQTKSVINEISSSSGYFSQLNYLQRGREVLVKILKLTSQSTIGPQTVFGSLIFILIIFIFLFINLRKKAFDFKFKFVFFTLILWLTSIFWFVTNKGMASWHLVGLPPIIFISLFLTLNVFRPFLFFRFRNKFGMTNSVLKKKHLSVILNLFQYLNLTFFLQILFLALHLISFFKRDYFKLSDNQSMLRNELKAINWVYEQSGNKGFKVYTFLPSVYDYPYQYLFPWYGKKKYGYLPCEYSTYPSISASTYVKDSKDYQEKEKQCLDGLFFLIIEPAVEKSVLDQWYQGVTKQSELIEKAKVGKITLEKRRKI